MCFIWRVLRGAILYCGPMLIAVASASGVCDTVFSERLGLQSGSYRQGSFLSDYSNATNLFLVADDPATVIDTSISSNVDIPSLSGANPGSYQSFSAIIQNILFGCLGSLLAVIVERGIRKARYNLRRKATKRFWSLTKNRITIVHPIYHDMQGQPLSERLARLDILSAVYSLIEFFNANDIKYSIQSDSLALPADSDVILLSSPKGNRQSRALYDSVNLPFEIIWTNSTFYLKFPTFAL